MQSSLVEGKEGFYHLYCQTSLVIVLHKLFLLFWHFKNATAYNLGQNEPSSHSTQVIHDKRSSSVMHRKHTNYTIMSCFGRTYTKVGTIQRILAWAAVVAQLVERLLPTAEVRISNPVIGKILFMFHYQLY